MKISRALLSVSDKTGIIEFASFLQKKGVSLISTGGTARLLRENGLAVEDVSDVTHFPEMLDGRVKTLHPTIHGGILFVRGNDEHEKIIAEHKIGAIDLVVVNLYPFRETIARGVAEEEAIENIDIGGPSMIRSAAKNFDAVTVLVDPTDFSLIEKEIEEYGETTRATRRMLSAKAFSITAQYDAAIAGYFDINFSSLFLQKKYDLRYGENPHQSATFFASMSEDFPSLATAKVLQGKSLGYCNILDADAALRIALEFSEPVAVIIKHATPCGVAVGNTTEEAYEKALSCDPVSAFGGIVAVNRTVSKELAEKLSEIFLEVILAPEFSEEAQEILKKKESLRLLETGEFSTPKTVPEYRSVLGGLLRQDRDTKEITESDLTFMTEKPTQETISDLLFAWKVCKFVKSNAIVIAKNGQTLGIGGGQTSRVKSSEIATKQAEEKAKGAVAASDAFFPFSDGVEFLSQAGVNAIIQPGGSKRDEEIINTAKEQGIAMVFTKTRAFRH